MRMMDWGLEVAQHPPAKSPLRDWGRMGEGQLKGREEEEEREGAQPQHGDVEMWRWSGYLMAGG